MAANQSSQDHQAYAGPKPLSCVSCRQRKIKCDKTNPCSQCQAVGLVCVTPNRARVPRRPRQSAAKARDAELLRRISKLEALVSKTIPAIGTSEKSNENGHVDAARVHPEMNLHDRSEIGGRLDEQYASFIKRQVIGSNHPSGDFWTSLSDEFTSLRHLLEDSIDDEVDNSMSTSPRTDDLSQHLIFQDLFPNIDLAFSYPSDANRWIMFDFYFANVHPVLSILHKPTATRHFRLPPELLERETGRFKFASLEAIFFAMYYIAVTSISSQECLRSIGEEREVLRARFRSSTEIALARADFMNSAELVTLQAFVIYIVRKPPAATIANCLTSRSSALLLMLDQVALRSDSQSRSSWALIGLAVRIAHGLGIHKDGDGKAFSAFDAEMRRRLWWHIIVLDVQISEDRGSGPLIAEGSFNTRMPCNLNDVDFGFESQHPLPDKKGVTDIVSCLLTMDTSNTRRRINYVPVGSEQPSLTLTQKEEIVKKCITSIKTHYLVECGASKASTSPLSMTARLLVLKLWMSVQYPLQGYRPAIQNYIRGQSLRIIVEVLSLMSTIEENDSAAPFQWYFQASVPWHVLAVALVELCKDSHSQLADRAWQIIDKKWSERIAAMKGDMLARSLQALLQKARTLRKKQQQYPTPDQGSSTAFEIINWDPLWQSTPVDLLPWDNEPFAGADMLSGAVNMDDWNTFLLDANAAELDFPPNAYGDWLTDG